MGCWRHQRENIIRASSIPATFLRPGGFGLNDGQFCQGIGVSDRALEDFTALSDQPAAASSPSP